MNKPIPQETLAAIKSSVFQKRKIEAIKLYRDATGAGLAEAKAAVEQLQSELRAAPPQTLNSSSNGRGSGCSLLGGCVFLLLGAVFVVGGLSMEKGLRFSSGSASTEGTVVKIEFKEDTRSDKKIKRAWHPVVEYQVDGVTYEYVGVGGDQDRYTAGQKVPVVYKLEQPDVASIDSLFDRWLVPVAFAGAGVVFVAIGFLLIAKTRGRRSAGPGEGVKARPQSSSK